MGRPPNTRAGSIAHCTSPPPQRQTLAWTSIHTHTHCRLATAGLKTPCSAYTQPSRASLNSAWKALATQHTGLAWKHQTLQPGL